MRSVERASAGCWDRDEQDRHCFGAIASLSCYQFMKVKGLGLDQVGLEWKGYRERITLEESRKQPWHQTWPWANHISHWASFSPVKWRYCSLIAKVYYFFSALFCKWRRSALFPKGWVFLPKVSVPSRDLAWSSPDNSLPATPSCTEQDDRVIEIMEFSFFSHDLSFP